MYLKRHIQFQFHIIDKTNTQHEIDKEIFLLRCLTDKSASDVC